MEGEQLNTYSFPENSRIRLSKKVKRYPSTLGIYESAPDAALRGCSEMMLMMKVLEFLQNIKHISPHHITDFLCNCLSK